MSNKIKYVGNVRIRIDNKQVSRRHNNGTSAFFDVLRDILITSVDYNTSRLPFYMALVKKPESDASTFFEENSSYNSYPYESLKLVLTPVLITSRAPSAASGSCVLSALLPNSILIKNNDKNNNVNFSELYTLLLAGDDNRTVLAFSKNNYTEVSALFEDDDKQGIIEWELTFDNTTEDNNE